MNGYKPAINYLISYVIFCMTTLLWELITDDCVLLQQPVIEGEAADWLILSKHSKLLRHDSQST